MAWFSVRGSVRKHDLPRSRRYRAKVSDPPHRTLPILKAAVRAWDSSPRLMTARFSGSCRVASHRDLLVLDLPERRFDLVRLRAVRREEVQVDPRDGQPPPGTVQGRRALGR